MPGVDRLQPRFSQLPARLDAEASASTPDSRGLGRLLTGSWALRLLIPLLVGATGLALLLVGDAALRRSIDRLAQARFADQSAVLGEHLRLALERAQPRLDALAALLATDGLDLPRTRLAEEMRLSLERNPAIAWFSVSTPDGHFRGMRRTTGPLQFLESVPGAEERTTVRGDGALGAPQRAPTDYDPRRRPFYIAAVAATGRVWTEPYTFYKDGITGITCATALRGADGGVLAVLSLDFDSDSLGAALSELPTIPGSRTFVIAPDGAVLGTTGEPLRGSGGNRVVKLRELPDPHLLTVVQAVLGGGSPTGALQAEQGIRIAVRPVSPTPGQTWEVVSYAPESEITAATGRLRGIAAAVGGAAVVAAVACGWFVAGVLTRARRERALARNQARQALAAANDLGAYRLVERLGEGGMGEVWRAEHRQLARPAAIKLMRQLGARDAEVLRSRFVREARVIAGLHSRHTVNLYDYGVSDDGTLYYVMELLDGVDLDRLVARFGPVCPRRTVAILRQICLSLAEAHDRGLVHRDIKPANISLCRLADEVDVVKVLDFGLVLPLWQEQGAPADPRLSTPGMVFGTPTCMAPEQAQGLELDGRADLYAVGCIAWWLLTGGTVFPATDGHSVLAAHVNAPVPDLRARCPAVAAGLAALVTDLLAKDPADRPADARAVLARLRAIADPGGEPWDEAIADAWWRLHLPPAVRPPAPEGPAAPGRIVPAPGV